LKPSELAPLGPNRVETRMLRSVAVTAIETGQSCLKLVAENVPGKPGDSEVRSAPSTSPIARADEGHEELVSRIIARSILGILASPTPYPSDRARHSSIAREDTVDLDTMRAHVQFCQRTGCLQGRYLPVGLPTRVAKIGFIVGRAAGWRLSSAAKWLSKLNGTVLLWTGSHTGLVFAVVMVRTEAEAKSLLLKVRDDASVVQGYAVLADPCEEGIPIYFDYEGMWRRVMSVSSEGSPLGGYPRGYPAASRPDETWLPSSSRHGSALRELVCRHGKEPTEVRGIGLLVNQRELSEDSRYVIDQGYVKWRAFLEPQWLPRFQYAATGEHGLRPPYQVTVTIGLLKPGVLPSAFLTALMGKFNFRPALFASGGRATVFVTYGPYPQSIQSELQPTGGDTRSLWRNWLQWEFPISQPLVGLNTLIDHRYERLVAFMDDASRTLSTSTDGSLESRSVRSR
jgi:hypothetical protein